MRVIQTTEGVRELLKSETMKPHGFVPTMGALHRGHLELTARAIKECKTVTVSIFVNPTQFNDKNDLARYPRTVEADINMLSEILRTEDIIFIPEVEEIYPEKDNRVFDFGTTDKSMEGLHRPGHFNGVAQVVSKLFEIVTPDIAYFGQKDFQQLAVIREMVRQKGYRVRIQAFPTVREEDGLAMSSRNSLLTTAHRKAAPVIYRSLVKAADTIGSNGIDAARQLFAEAVNSVSGFRLQYFEVVDDTNLIPIKSLREVCNEKKYFICVAVFAGDIRLIDNIAISLE